MHISRGQPRSPARQAGPTENRDCTLSINPHLSSHVIYDHVCYTGSFSRKLFQFVEQTPIMSQSSGSAFGVRVTKDTLVFSAAHFITFNGTICERIHGHNWRVEAAIEGPLDENSYVFDFIALRDGLQALVQELDHRVLLPDRHPAIHVITSDDGREVTARFEDRRWVFPAEDCCILPIANTTAELISRWIGQSLISRLKLDQQHGLTRLRVSVEENFGQWADCWLNLN